jgi:hypothetical protein
VVGVAALGFGEPCRDHRGSAKRTSEEPPGRTAIAAGRDQHVDDLPMLVDGPVDVAPLAVDLEVGHVGVPPIARCMTGESGSLGQ